MSRVALIDYGSGNLRSAEKALEAAACLLDRPPEVVTTADPDRVATADRLVLPGVGAFGTAMAALKARPGLVEAMETAVHERGAPFLGVCVGMQLLATVGHEFGEHAGLGWIAGEVRRIAPATPSAKTPHVGWNTVEAAPGQPLFAADEPEDFYFTHSYVLHAEDEGDVAAWSDHGGRFVAAVRRGTVAGVQFHPEKSQRSGLALIARFLEWRP